MANTTTADPIVLQIVEGTLAAAESDRELFGGAAKVEPGGSMHVGTTSLGIGSGPHARELKVAIPKRQTTRMQTAEPDVAAVASYLREQLGERITAVIGGVRDAGIVRAWAAGATAPDPETERTLRATYEVTRMLREVDCADTVRLWFSGMNTELDDRAPGLVIREDPAAVLSAARFYLAHG